MNKYLVESESLLFCDQFIPIFGVDLWSEILLNMISGLGNEIVDKYELSILCSIYVGHIKSKNLETEKEISGQCTFTKGSMYDT